MSPSRASAGTVGESRRPSRGDPEAGGQRRRRLSAEQRRRQLVNATVEAVARHGYQAATVDVIANMAGVSKGLAWHYFSDRDELMEATARHTLDALRSAVAADVDMSASTAQIIRAAMQRAVALRRTHAEQLTALHEIVVHLRWHDGTNRLGVADYAETYRRQEEIFRRGQERGEVATGYDPHILAVTYQGMVDAMLDYVDAHPGTDATAHAAMVANIFLDGVGPHPRTGKKTSTR